MFMKRALVFALATILIVLSSVSANATTYLKGDVNDSGEIDAKDYILVKKAVLLIVDLTKDQELIADVNDDGEVDSKDYILMIFRRTLVISIVS